MKLTKTNDTLQLSRLTGLFGINIYGWHRGDFGGGRTGRTIVSCLHSHHVPLVAINITGAEYHTHNNHYIDNLGLSGSTRDFSIDLLVINAANTPRALNDKSNGMTNRHYRIGFWHWETSFMPDELGALGQHYDEIWAPSEYVAKAIRNTPSFPIHTPIHIFPYGYESIPDYSLVNNIRQARDVLLSRLSEVGVDWETQRTLKMAFDEKFLVFLTIFDFNSDIFRKNIPDTITAFKTAFPVTDTGDRRRNVLLVIKTINSNYQPDDFAHLKWLMENDRRIVAIHHGMDEYTLQALKASADVYISLHRSEGWGLNVLESVMLGRIVICSAWSGTDQFMLPLYGLTASELLIPTAEVPVRRAFGPYSTAMTWGQPDVGAAVYALRLVQNRPDYYRLLAEDIRQSALRMLSPQALGTDMAARARLIHYCLCLLREEVPSQDTSTSSPATSAEPSPKTDGEAMQRCKEESSCAVKPTLSDCVDSHLGRRLLL